MTRIPRGGPVALAFLALLWNAVPARPCGAFRSQRGTRVAMANRIVVGRVTALESDPVDALPPSAGPRTNKVRYRVAVVEIREALVGAKDSPPWCASPSSPGTEGSGRRFRRWPLVNLTVGQEVCSFLATHPEETFLYAGPL